MRYRHLTVYLVAAAIAVVSAMSVPAGAQEGDWVLVYSEDWSQGSGGWSSGQSYLHDKRTPKRIFVGSPLAQYVYWFYGQCGWALRSGASVGSPMKIVFRVLTQGSHRNALSLNVRNRGGGLIYKYSMGPGNRVSANTQPMPGGGDDAVSTSLVYKTDVPYELTSIYVPGSGYYLSLKNLITGEEQTDGRRWRFKGGGSPSTLDFDQEGGHGPAGLGRVDVYLLQ